MKIYNRLALLLLTAGLAGCGSSNLGGDSKDELLPSTGAVITSAPTTSPTTANKATVGFRVVFPEQSGAQKAAINPAMARVNITADGYCGFESLDLTPGNNSGTLNLVAGDCSFFATAYDASNTEIDSTSSHGFLNPGPNNVSLVFLGGPWLFVNPDTNEKLPLTLAGNEVLTGIQIGQDVNGTANIRWIGPDTDGNGPTDTDLLGGTLTNLPTLRISSSFTGGTGAGANRVSLSGAATNLVNWERSSTVGDRIIKILGGNSVTGRFNPESFTNYFTSKVIDGTTLEGNIAELTVGPITYGTGYGSCTPTLTASKAAETTALTKALATARKAQTSLGEVSVTWTECLPVNATSPQIGWYKDVTQTYTNVTIHPFRAKSIFAATDSPLQIALDGALYAYKQALETEDPVKGLDMAQLRKAAGQFDAAVTLAGTDLSNTADTIRFFGAISRLAALAIDTESDGIANGLNNFGDVLDALGAPTDALSRSWSNTITVPEICDTLPPYDCNLDLPLNGTTTGQILTLLDTKINTQLDLAIADLGNIGAGFSYDFNGPDGVTNFDYGDVLALTAIAHGIKAELAIDMAYDLNLDIAATFNGTGPASIETFMAANLNIGELAPLYATELAQAKTDLQTALTTMQSAITVIAAEGTGSEQQSEFISFYKADYYNPYYPEYNRTDEELFKARDAINQALAALNGPITVDNKKTYTTTDDVIIDANKFFAGISFRSMLPGFTGDEANCLFPDASMGGILVQGVNVNEDVDGNGVTDLLEDENFYLALVSGNTYNTSTWLNTGGSINWTEFSLNSDNTVSAAWYYYSMPPQSGTATGTWSILPDGSLQINFAAGTAPLTITGMNLSLEDVDSQSQNFEARATLTFALSSTMTNWTWWSKMTQIP